MAASTQPVVFIAPSDPIAVEVTDQVVYVPTGVSSFNTRTGAVVPAAGDYTAAQTGALAAKAGLTNVPAAELSPQVSSLTDALTVAVNASLANHYRLALTSAIGATRAIAVPSAPTDGQKVTFEFVQPATGGPCSVTWTGGAGGFSFGSGTVPVLSTTASAVDLVAFVYSSVKGQWLYLGTTGGF